MMTEDQLQLEYAALKAVKHSGVLATRYKSVGCRKDFQGLMEKINQKTPLKEALKFSNKVGQLAENCQEAARLQVEVNRDLDANREVLALLQSLRREDKNFLGLLEGCLMPTLASQVQFNKFRIDWQRFKRRVERVPFYDPELARETELLECLCRIFHYYYRTMTESVYKVTKDLLLCTVKKWEAEDLISEHDMMQSVVSNFLSRGKSSRQEKDVVSNDDVATNHSSDQKILKSTIFSSFIRKRTTRGHPFESETSLAGETGYKKLSDEVELIGTKFPFPSKKSLCTQLKPTLGLKKGLEEMRSLNLQRASTARSPMVIDIDLEEGFVERLGGSSFGQSRLEHNEITIASLFDRARNTTKARLTEVIARHCHSKLARCYANKLEAEVFSQHFGSLKEYEQNSRKVVGTLRSILSQEGLTGSLMNTSFDYHEISKVAEKLQDLGQTTMQSSTENHTGTLRLRSVSTPSILDADPVKMLSSGHLEPFASDQLSLMDESNSQLLREVTRMKELEILELQRVIEKLDAENNKLRHTLAKVKTCLATS